MEEEIEKIVLKAATIEPSESFADAIASKRQEIAGYASLRDAARKAEADAIKAMDNARVELEQLKGKQEYVSAKIADAQPKEE